MRQVQQAVGQQIDRTDVLYAQKRNLRLNKYKWPSGSSCTRGSFRADSLHVLHLEGQNSGDI